MFRRRATPKLAAWLLATVLLAVQALAFAHELRHDLGQHDDASCVLHLQTKQAAHPGAPPAPLPADTSHEAVLPQEYGAVASAPILGYRTRAPPSSVRSI